MDGVALGPLVNNIGVVGGCLILVGLFVRDVIVSGKRLRKAERDVERWETIALNLMTAARTVVPAMETVHAIVSELPDPGVKEPAEEG